MHIINREEIVASKPEQDKEKKKKKKKKAK
jgi:hypothetical protein